MPKLGSLRTDSGTHMATATMSLSQLGQDAGAWQEIDSAGNGNDYEMHSNDWETAGDWRRGSENVSGADSAAMPYSSSEHMLGASLQPADADLQSEWQLEELLIHVDSLEAEIVEMKHQFNERVSDDEVTQIQFRASQADLETAKQQNAEVTTKLGDRNKQFEALEKRAEKEVLVQTKCKEKNMKCTCSTYVYLFI